MVVLGVHDMTGFQLLKLSDLRSLTVNAKQRTTPDVQVHRSVKTGSGGVHFVKFGLADKAIIAAGPGLNGGIGIWRLKTLVDGSDVRRWKDLYCRSV